MNVNTQLAINRFTGYDNFWNDLFETVGKKVIKYLSLDHYQASISNTDTRTKLRLNFQLSTKKYLHERRSGTVLGWLSDVGGFNDCVALILKPMIAYISALSFSISVTNDMPVIVKSKR